jgi:hypothetical protein
MSARPTRWQRLSGGLVGGALVLAVGLPAVGKLLRWEPALRVQEFRLPAQRPTLPHDAREAEEFPARFEAYFNDSFGLRPLLLRGMHRVKGRWLGVSTAANVLRGTDGWLYYTDRPAGTDYDAARPFTDEELWLWCRMLKDRRDWLASQSIRYLLFIPPDKQTVYPEHLPDALRPRTPQSRLDQLVNYLREHGGPEVLDVRAALLEAKRRERIYHATDSHWNDRGAFVGYRAVAGVLSGWFPAVQPLPRSAFLDVCRDEPGGDLAQMIASEDVFREEALRLEPLSPWRARRVGEVPLPADCRVQFAPHAQECDDPTLPRAVVFHDSFFWALEPLLSEHFRRAVCGWTDDFSREVVHRERPDVVIQELVERKLGSVSPKGFDPE